MRYDKEKYPRNFCGYFADNLTFGSVSCTGGGNILHIADKSELLGGREHRAVFKRRNAAAEIFAILATPVPVFKFKIKIGGVLSHKAEYHVVGADLARDKLQNVY